MADKKKVTPTKKSSSKSNSSTTKKKTTAKKTSTNNKDLHKNASSKKTNKTSKTLNSKKNDKVVNRVVEKKTSVKGSNTQKKDDKVVKEVITENKINEQVQENNVKMSFSKKVTSFFGKLKSKVYKKSDTKNVKKDKITKKVKKKDTKSKVSPVEKIKLFFSKLKNKFSKKNNKSIKKSNKKKLTSSKKQIVIGKKTKIALISLAVVCLLVLVLEGILLIVHRIKIDKNTVYYDALNSVVIDGTDIVAVGSSNFRYSKEYDYTNGLEKGKLIKYDKNGKIVFEKMYETGISTTFSSIISVSDGYIVVGSGVFSKDEQEQEAKEAFIIKYDKDGNVICEKFYKVITNTRFNKVIEVADGYVAVGQSIYANMEMGNHTTGGGIIVKYDRDGNEVWHNNHGGTKSGNFNDVVQVNGNLYVVGKDAVDSGNIIMYDKNGTYKWHKNYNYTDGIGFTGITYLDNTLYVVGSKKVLPDDYVEGDSRSTNNTDALLVAYDLDGNKKFEKTYGGSNYERYNSILTYRNELYVVGHTTSKDAGFKIDTDGELLTGLVVRYNKNGSILKKDVFGGSNNDNLTDIYTDGVCLYISGYSNSSNGNIITSKDNGKDYFGKVIKLDFKFRSLLIK